MSINQDQKEILVNVLVVVLLDSVGKSRARLAKYAQNGTTRIWWCAKQSDMSLVLPAQVHLQSSRLVFQKMINLYVKSQNMWIWGGMYNTIIRYVPLCVTAYILLSIHEMFSFCSVPNWLLSIRDQPTELHWVPAGTKKLMQFKTYRYVPRGSSTRNLAAQHADSVEQANGKIKQARKDANRVCRVLMWWHRERTTPQIVPHAPRGLWWRTLVV